MAPLFNKATTSKCLIAKGIVDASGTQLFLKNDQEGNVSIMIISEDTATFKFPIHLKTLLDQFNSDLKLIKNISKTVRTGECGFFYKNLTNVKLYLTSENGCVTFLIVEPEKSASFTFNPEDFSVLTSFNEDLVKVMAYNQNQSNSTKQV